LFEEHSSSFSSPYLFNGKELDRETNLSYYGARYLDMKTSLWLSVDPLALYNPIFEDEFYFDGDHNGGVYNSGNLSNYNYCYQNPIKYVDPNGKQNVAGALIGAVVGGGIELGGQLLSGKSLDEVDFADVGIEALKGGLIGSGAGVVLLPYLDAAASTAKASIDYTKEKGFKSLGGIIGEKKSVGEFAYDAGSDFIGGKIGDFGSKKIVKMAEGSVKKMIKAETKAVQEVVRAENKFIKATKGGTKLTSDSSRRAATRLDVANSSATVARKNTVRAQMVKGTVAGPGGKTVNEGAQNTVIDNIKDLFGIGD
jgi:RHS repeat-associated protein